ncbi:MAG: DUF4386 family protein [Bacteroidetes bacterium]|nr:DUF4386 family protein [Bacteroidota bacterium]
MLIIKSNFIPKIIGALLILGGFTYVLDSSLALVFPEIKVAISPFVAIPLAFGEFFNFFMAFRKGVKKK